MLQYTLFSKAQLTGIVTGNCEPRNQATLHETKKKGPSKRKFFWKCDDCGFFLWYDEAKVRESGLTCTSPAEELGDPPKPKMPSLTQRSLVSYGYQVTPGRSEAGGENSEDLTESGSDSGTSPDIENGTSAPNTLSALEATPEPSSSKKVPATLEPSARAMETPSRGSPERKWDALRDEDDEYSDIASDEERQMVIIADQSASKMSAQRTFTTPSNTRSVDIINGLPTPSVARTLFPGSNNKRQKQVSFENTPSRCMETLSPITSSILTAPSKVSSVPRASFCTGPTDTSYDVTDEVMGLLQGQHIDPALLRSVQTVLATAARGVQGIVISRDKARSMVKARDERIATLEERVVALDNREKMHRNQVTNIKANLMKMYEDI